jgi:hypothetical protein
MDFYYVMVDFYPDLNKADEFEEAWIPYHTYYEAVAAIEATMDIYDDNNELDVYETFFIPDIKSTVGFITIKDNDVTRAFRFEVIKGHLGITRPN